MINGIHRLRRLANIGSIVLIEVANFSRELAMWQISRSVFVFEEHL